VHPATAPGEMGDAAKNGATGVTAPREEGPPPVLARTRLSPRGEDYARVLIVDDHPENLTALEATLGGMPVDLVRAESGVEALRHVLRDDFAVILMDVRMPGMDGFEVASLIKERERSRYTPIIFLSAARREERYVFRGYELGAVDYITKPFDPDVLRSKVAVFVDLFHKNQRLARQAELLRESDERERRRAEEFAVRNRGLDAFAALTEAVGSGLDFHSVLVEGTSVLVDYLGRSFAAFYSQEGGQWRCVHQTGQDPPGLFELAGSLLADGWLKADASPAFFEAGPEEARLRLSGCDADAIPLNEELAPHGAFALALLPVAAGTPSGWALACGVLGRGEWNQGDKAVARSIAHALGIALERARLVEERERARHEAEILSTLSRTLELASTPSEVAREAVTYLAAPTKVESFVLWRVQSDHASALGVYGAVEEVVRNALAGGLERPKSGMWQAIDSGQPVYIGGSGEEGRLLEEYERAGFRTVAHIPVLAGAAGEHQDGPSPSYLLTCLRSTAEPWTEHDARLLEAGGRSIGVALERARHAQEREAQAARLRAQNAELEARNAEQETFVYTVSHDLRQPLLAIHGMANLLEESVQAGQSDEISFLVSRVTRNVEKMGQLLNDLLALSRAGRVIEPPERLPLSEVAASVLADLQPRLSDRKVRLELPEHWPEVLYPRPAAYQVLANLLGNAAKFAGRKGRRPLVRVQCDIDESHATLRISDNGPGIPCEYREKVFGLFQKIDPHAEGTGVGLAIVKRIIESNHGRVSIEEGDLGGACFVLTMPLAKSSGPPAI
jgi:signal transduction histidine kinase/DNA-binding response OmpR family regulator